MLKTQTNRAQSPTRKTLDAMWCAWMEQFNWKEAFGRRMNSCLQVYRAMHEIAYKANNFEFGASERRITLEGGLGSKNTAKAATKALIEAGVIERLPTEELETNRYRLLWPNKKRTNLTHLRSSLHGNNDNGSLLRLSVHWAGDDSFAGAPTTWRTYVAVASCETPPTAKEVAVIIDMSVATARRHLNKLSNWGLCVRVKGKWFMTDVEASELPDIRKTYGIMEYRRKQFQREREAFEALTRHWSKPPKPFDPETGEILTVGRIIDEVLAHSRT